MRKRLVAIRVVLAIDFGETAAKAKGIREKDQASEKVSRCCPLLHRRHLSHFSVAS
jgi:hypothetical protein